MQIFYTCNFIAIVIFFLLLFICYCKLLTICTHLVHIIVSILLLLYYCICMAKKKSPKRYVVRQGKATGVFSTREECKKAVHGYQGAQYKSYGSKSEAITAYTHNYRTEIKKSKDAQPTPKDYLHLVDPKSIAVDAACSSNPGILERR
jgi:predicted membrane protein